MLYIKLKKEEKIPTIINKLGYLYKICRSGFLKKTIENGEIIVLPKLNKRTEKKLIKYLSMYNVQTVCLAEELVDSKLRHNIEILGIKILDGKWLYKYLIKNIVEYVVSKKQSEMQHQEISILVNKITEIDIENIMLLADKCKSVNVVTPSGAKLKKLEEYLYNEKGIIINITQNYSKSLIKSDIIINMDFSEEELNKYLLPRKAVIINLENEAKILNKGFDGINIFSYKIIIPKKYVSEELNLDSFNKEILYESFLYRKTNPRNIIKIIEEDNLKVECLIGVNGEIKMNEYSRLQPNRR